MEKYLKEQLIKSKIIAILIKGGLSSFGAYEGIPPNTTYWILAFAFFFNVLYTACSIFQCCLEITGNYIIGAIVFIGSLIILFSTFNKIENNIGSVSIIVLILFVLIFFVSDIIGLIKLIRIPVE